MLERLCKERFDASMNSFNLSRNWLHYRWGTGYTLGMKIRRRKKREGGHRVNYVIMNSINDVKIGLSSFSN